MGCSDNDSRFSNTLTLATWYYEHLKTVPLFESSKLTPDGDPLIARVTDTDWTDKTVDATVADANATVSYFDLEGDISLKVDTVDFLAMCSAATMQGPSRFVREKRSSPPLSSLPQRRSGPPRRLNGSLCSSTASRASSRESRA